MDTNSRTINTGNVKNNNSQTLFRFVSMRNPQLTETKKENLGFIHRPVLNNDFDLAVKNRSGISKIQALENQCKSFSSPLTEKDLENSQYASLLKIGRKITKKEILSAEELAKTKDAYSSGQMEVEKLWNNLIYQVITQKDFYAKEALVHILKALHVGYVQTLSVTEELAKINGKDLVAKALDAKVVMPKELFVEDEVVGIASSASKTASKEIAGLSAKTVERIKGNSKNDLAATKALLKKEQLEKLNAELEKIQKSYNNNRSTAQQEAYKEYLSKYLSQMEEYNKLLNEIEHLAEEKGSEEELERLYERLKKTEVPPFEFYYPGEINIPDLKAKLSAESFELFMNLFASQPLNEEFYSKVSSAAKVEAVSDAELRIGAQSVQIDENYQTFNSVFSELQTHISQQAQSVLENTELPQTQYANIGGALIPVVNTSPRTHLAYSLLANWRRSAFVLNSGFINFSFEVEDNSWSVANAKITMESNTGIHEETLGNTDVLNGVVSFPALMVNTYSSISRIRIDIFFNNGREAYLELFKIPTNELQVGMLTLKPGRVRGEEEPVEEISNTRKLFGLKRLGIAEYMKVVQSTHAYVPGDVTHIENIMAREFKQKSTRRLRKSEIQTTASKSTERETLTDTTSTTRNDLQSEVANVIQQDFSAEAHANWSKDTKLYGRFEVGGSLATHNAKENSVRQAVTQSQEITNKATDRLLTKISEERIEKIIEEYEENNSHGFDNRNGDKHVVGVYRWVDMKYKNQIYNYGKRTMFEFMIPEPARLHRLALAVAKADVLTAPVDPRKAPAPYTMAEPKTATRDLLQYWANIYSVKLTDLPTSNMIVTSNVEVDLDNSATPRLLGLSIPVNYKAYEAEITYAFYNRFKKNSSWLTFDNLKGGAVNIENPHRQQWLRGSYTSYGINVVGNYNMQYAGGNGTTQVGLVVKAKCTLSDAYMLQWATENFNAIIDAYEEAYKKFQEEQKRLDEEQKKKEAEAKDKMGNFYRYMESDVLKHNCIAYLLQDYLSPNTVGQNFTDGDKMENFQVFLNENLDKYTALAKFMEQAFEWSIMSYSFYPYYWANRQHWQEMYVSESVDPLFRSFLQSGMARVIVTVRPGFEDAIQFFLSTGKIWNGEEVPVIGDPMYMSIVDEMREPVGLKQGKPWITKLPTTLTILQEGSTGLKTVTALPFSQENPAEFENPEEVVTSSEFAITDAQLSSGAHRFVENIDIKDGNLQLTTDSDPRKVIAQISMQSIKNNLP